MKLILVAAALSAVSYAQIDMAKITDCSALLSECRTGPSANQATCVAGNAQCEQCQTDYNQCRAPGNGVSGNQAGCAAQVANCVASAFPSLKDSLTGSSSDDSDDSDDSEDCQGTFNACVAGGKSEDLCSCDFASCLGEDNARTRDYCAAASASASAPASTATGSSDPCQSTYNACVAGGKSEDLCSCDFATCLGEDNARTRAYCASLSAGLATPTGAGASAATGLATSGVARPTSAVGGVGSNSTSSTPIVTGAAASVGVSMLGAASAFFSYLLM